jgi:Ca2+-binding RTX toxin-like protein/6-phosphogluconolactonase (cycloisomerase 2 family)
MRFSDWLIALKRPSRRCTRRDRQPGRQQRVAAVLETLEDRVMLSGVTTVDYEQVAPEWFGSEATDDLDTVGPTAPTSRYIVRLTEWMSSRTGDVDSAGSLLACETDGFRVVGGLGLPGQLLLEVDTHREDEVVNALSGHPFVESLERDTSVSGAILPNDTRFSDLSGLHNIGAGDGIADADIDAAEAWEIQTGSHAIVVATLDTGLDYTHPDLYQNVWINPGEIPAVIAAALVDTDSDGLTTFVDLNHPDNSGQVTDHNGNSYIDAGDLLADSDWEDGVDTDANGKIDDLVGWDFANGDNDPYDDHRHGTHVAGIIGARGNNATGVTGVNWTTSLLTLKFLDEHNNGATSDAIHAINYATSLRSSSGSNIRVLNNSWGGLGGYNANLRSAISAADANGMLFVAAAGNGNVLGRGIDLDADEQPFYPASYDLDNVLAVAATDSYDNLALFSNHGIETIDLAAPGLDVLSTEPGGGYVRRNGTSMAAPFASGAAALIWSELPDATVAEVTAALTGGVDAKAALDGTTVTGGRLNIDRALGLDTYSPRGELTVADEVTSDGGTTYDFEVLFRDNVLVEGTTLDANDILVVPIEHPDEAIAATWVSSSTIFDAKTVTVTYRIVPPGGSWQVSDNGVYQVVLQPGEVSDTNLPANFSSGGVLGSFEVSIAYAGQIDIDTLSDGADANPGDGNSDDGSGNSTLRSAIQEANASAGSNTLVLTEGAIYTLSIAGAGEDAAASGDLDITDDLVIHGNGATIEVTGNIDRVLDVHAGATLTLRDLTITGGSVTGTGGGVRNAGDVDAGGVLFFNNTATGNGGGLYNSGTLTMTNATVSGNTVTADGSQGAGITNTASGTVTLESVTITDNDVTGASDARGRQVIDTGLAKPESLQTGDIDGDGDLDLVVGVETGAVWYANDGSGTFGDSVAICLCHDEDATGTRALNLVDVDDDGDLDVFFAPAVPGTSPVQGWYENDGSGAFTERSLETLDLIANDAEAFDYDGDGDQDLLFTLDSESGGVAGSVTVFRQQLGQGTFPSQTISNSVDGAYRLVATDLDGDGDTDAISAGLVDDTIAWHENDGSQNFTKRVIANDVTDARSVFSVDVDGDGDVDVIAASEFKDTITWYENDGSQNFTTHTITTTADGVFGVFASDVDGDGDVDVLSASTNDDTVAWYENDGSENFSAHTIAADVDFATSVYAVDIDGDGDIDVLSSSFTEGIAWYENDGSENFSTQAINTSVQGAQTVTAADVDGDGDIDVLSASQNDDTIAWYANDGDESFSMQVITEDADGAKTVVAADIDGDGDIDVLSASAANDTVSFFKNDGSENFTETKLSTSADGAQGVFAADVDSDGDLDVLSASENDDTIAWFENDVGMSFTAVNLDIEGAGHWALEAGDFDGDGDTDLAVSTTEATISSGRLSFLQKLVDPPDVSFAEKSVIHSVDGAEAGGAADFDGDGDQDVLTTYRQGVKLMLGNGDGTFASPVDVGGSLGIPRAMTIADLDGDSDFDFVVGEVHGGRLLAWYENNGSASFTQRTIGNLPGHINGITHVDYDGDGDLDLVVAFTYPGGSTGGQFSKFTNNGDGTFTSPGNLSDTGTYPWGVSAADFDGDGDQDLVVSGTGSSPVVAWYANDGSGNFAHQANLSTTYGAEYVTTGDLNGDGTIDVLVAAGSHNKVVWYANNGSGLFSEQAALSTTVNGARWVLAVDLDEDGDLDVAAASNSSKIVWFRHENGTGSFSGEIILANDMTSSDGLAAADVNGDGVMDIITSDHLVDRIYWHRGVAAGGWDNLISPVVSPDGSSVFVGDNTNHALWILGRDSSSGELTANTVLTDGENGVDGLTGVSGLAISPDGKHIYTAGQADNAIGVFRTEDAAFIEVVQDGTNGVDGLAGVRDVVLSNDGKHVYAAGATDNAVAVFSRNTTTGSLSFIEVHTDAVNNVDGLAGASAVAISPDDKNVYVTGAADQEIATFSRNLANGELTFVVAIGDGSGSWLDNVNDVAVPPSGSHVYSTSPDGNAVGVYDWDTDLQALELVETVVDGVADVDGLDGAWDAVVSPDGYHVYVAGKDEDKLSLFSRDTVTGELSLVQVLQDGVESVDGLDAVAELVISPDGDHLYATGWDDNSITVFNRETIDDPAPADIHWLRNDGGGVFSRQSTISVSLVTHTLASGDLDGDGDLDLLAASDADDSVLWYRNNGTGSFTVGPIISDSEGAERVLAVDMDADGDLDVLTTSRLDDTVGWYSNNGSGVFGGRLVLDNNLDGADGLNAVDLDADGVLDVVAVGNVGGELTWYPGSDPIVVGLLNTAGGTVTLHNTLIASESPETNLWDTQGTFNSNGYNLIGNAGNSGGLGTTDQVGRGNSPILPLLGPLADNTGPTWTHALLEDSPAIDAGSIAASPPGPAPALDQRGIDRPQDADEDGTAINDIGAVERYFVELSGTKFQDSNANRVRDAGEAGLAGWTMFLDENGNHQLDFGELKAITRADDPATTADEAGTFSFTQIVPDRDLGVDEVPQDGWEQISPVVTGFQNAVHFEVVSGQALMPYQLVAGDFDADGHVDLATTLYDNGKVAVMFNDGTGAFTVTDLNHGLLTAMSLSSGDMDGDGDLDLVTMLRGHDEVAVLLNDGLGSFDQADSEDLGGGGGHAAMGMKVGDLDGDGDLDVVTANTDTNTVSVLFNGTTAGTFDWSESGPVVYAVGDTPRGLEVADLDGDGDLDVAVADSVDEVLRILVNDGSGAFTTHGTLLPAGRHPRDIVAADLDGDGDLDLATSNSNSDDISVFLNLGNMVFDSESRYSTGEKPQYKILAVDIDGDGVLDLVVPNQNDDMVSILRNEGDGTFRESEAFAVGDKPWSITAADFDGDGDIDLVSTNFADASLSLLINTTGVGGYSGNPSPGTVVDGLDFGNKPLPAKITGRVYRDLNGNGIPDAGEAGLPGWTVFLDTNGDGELDDNGNEPSRSTDANGNYLFADLEPLLTYTVVQVDQEHYQQTAPPSALGQKWTITPEPGEVFSGQDFGDQDLVSGASGGTGIIKGRHFDDLNTNGQQDVEELGLPGMTVYLDINNNGSRDTGDDAEPTDVTDVDGKYQFNSLPESVYTVRTEPATVRQQTAPLGNQFETSEHTAGDGPQWISHGDFDNDGDTDLAVANQVNNTVSLLINDGDGGFSESAAPYVGAGPESVALADFNGDGRLDLAVGHQYTNYVSVLLDDGDGGYEAKVDYTTAGGAGAVTTGDFNSDGYPDLAVANEFASASGSDTLTVLLNQADGSGTFDTDSSVTLNVGNAPVSVVSGDFNADGKEDLAVANMDDNSVQVLLNAGGASFPSQATFTFVVGTGPFHLATGDLDDDGDIDLATANVLSDSISILTNAGNGTSFSVSSPLPAGSGPASLVAEDLDSDGDLDLAATNRNTENLAILRNLGDGTFQSPENFGVADFSTPLAWSVVAVDLDGDGDIDLAVANGDADLVSILDNTLVPGSFRVTVDDGATVSGVDFGFGIPAIVTTDFSDGTLTIEADDVEPWDITVDVLDGNVRVLVGDTADESIGTIDPSDVIQIIVTGSAGAEVIDLSGVTAADFDHASGLTTHVEAGGGNDTIIGSGLPDTILGELGSDSISGDTGNDSLVGGDGDDTVEGQAGDDTVLGGPGDDRLSGSDGDDYMESESGADTFLGGAGNDTIRGGADNDELYGQGGDDVLYGEDDDDVLSGGAGNDTLNSGSGNDTLNGNSGSDQIVGDDENVVLTVDLSDAVLAGSTFEILAEGTELLVRQQGGAELSRGTIDQLSQLILHGTANDDTIQVDFSGGNPLPTGGLFVDASSGGGSDRLETLGTGVSSVVHTFAGSTSGTVTVDGRPIDHSGISTLRDAVTTTTRSFTVGDGDDVITVDDDGTSADGISRISLSVFSGTIDFAGPTDKLVVSVGNGADTVTIVGLDSGVSTASLLLNGQNDSDTLDASGSQLPVKLNGSGGDDVLTGGTANDTLNGGAGMDALAGGAGNDRLQGQGSSYDTLSGGPGDDTLDGGDGYDRISESADVDFTATDSSLTGLGNDTLINIQLVQLFGGSTANTIDASAFSGRAFLNGSGGNDTLTGGGWYDRIFGGSGRDLITGGTSVIDPGPGTYTYDVLRGQGGNYDTLIGGDGNDKLNGGIGRDSLVGGGGDDVLSGESGNDTIDGGLGTDRLYERGDVDLTLTDTGLSGGLGSDVVTSVETAYLKGGNGNNHLDASSFSGDVTLIGVGGADTLEGGAGNDMLNGRSGNDLMLGGDGDDTLKGMRDADTLNGGAGDDWIDGGTQDDAISGWTGDDELYGRSGNDTLVGGEGNDSLYGASGDDILQGDDGKTDSDHARDDDRLDGGTGGDTVRGGGGSDTNLDDASEIDENFAYWAEWVDAV